MKVALIQTTLEWENPEANRKLLETRIKALETDTGLVVLPEMFTSGFTMSPEGVAETMEGNTLEWMRKWAAEKDAAITGSVVIADNNKYYNRLLFVHPEGKVEYYDKRHAFTLAGEEKVYGTGDRQLVVRYRGWKICLMICYDLRFPVWSRNTTAYDMILYVANWPLPRIGAWDTLLRARAIENLSYCIGVNRVGEDHNGHRYPGHSAVYDALGNLSVFSEHDETLYSVLDREHIISCRDKYRFLDDRDDFALNV
ncbi:amidohydrolase [Sinomicrobium soli]|uniref:amidohydrolase n=1 Tax=Sinomicrobium sp. N-1-3-6 TaxID=2219864 RepID=UPI000DCC70FE|nr:amidohydrolase [Sinomicrobium sp. N-1-3-6]RAV27585.1 amidohydrolase [Sinomicrobium sp. N-1-3-6]